MKRTVLSTVLLIITFVVVYLSLCYLVPAWRIKLDADPVTYFNESIRHMALLKSLFSVLCGSIVATFPFLIKKKGS